MEKDVPIVVVKGVGKSYGTVEALKEVSFVVERGEIFGLIGPDGAGKSTLFRILTTLLLADKGTATIGGLATEYKQIRTKVGYMPGRFSLYQDLSVEENLEFFATVFHTTVQENYDLIKDIYQQIEPFRKRRAGALSGGMKQKLALSCALIHKPDILFLDEPTTGVDPVSRKEFWQMLRNLREQGITIVVSTPIMDEARQCDRIAFINHGKIHGIDTPERILQQFASILCPPSLEREEVRHETAPVIEVEQLTKCFGNFTAVDHISFQVNRGEIFGFLGANGAGKTTAMRMLCGLSKPTSGIGKVAGYDIFREAEQVKKHIGYMSQKFSLYEDLKVWENIRLFAGIYGMKEQEIERKTEELLDRLGLADERDTLVKSLPVGWKQKLAFSVSIFHEPRIVFLDEPTGRRAASPKIESRRSASESTGSERSPWGFSTETAETADLEACDLAWAVAIVGRQSRLNAIHIIVFIRSSVINLGAKIQIKAVRTCHFRLFIVNLHLVITYTFINKVAETKYIFVTGGVVSSLGKGIISSSIGKLLQARGYNITIQKFDPYINIDPGTLNPYEHGECYVTVDGMETDLDLGHYERFTGIQTTKANSMTTGRIYKSVIDKERRGDYLGKTIQVVPHITDEIKRNIKQLGQKYHYDFVITEIGGTIGDIESAPFMEAIRQMKWELGDRAINVHLTYVPYLHAAGELKTKPTQHSVKELQSVGIQPDVLVLRTEKHLDEGIRYLFAERHRIRRD